VKMSVLIVSYRRPELLANCLRSLQRQTRLPDEVLVVGVEGDEATAEVVRRCAAASAFPVAWYATPTPSVVAQTNLGLTHATGDVVAFTNDDAEPFPDWLARIEPYYEDETIGGVGGRDYIHLADGRILDGQADCVGRITWFGRVHGNHHLSFPQVVDVDVLKGVNMSCRREVLEPLDLRMVQGGRWHWELDMCLGVRQIGKRLVFDPRICVDHFHFQAARPTIVDPKFVYAANHNLTLNLMKYFVPWRQWAFLFYTFLWGDFPEMGLAVFGRTYLKRLIQRRDWGFIRLLGISLRAKWDALRALARRGVTADL